MVEEERKVCVSHCLAQSIVQWVVNNHAAVTPLLLRHACNQMHLTMLKKSTKCVSAMALHRVLHRRL
jgi:hypothetical protein